MLSISQLLEERDALLDAEVSVQGVFLHDGTTAFLVGKESDNADSGVLVEHPDLLKVLFSSVPAYGGGKYLYKDSASLTGTLRSVSSQPVLDNLSFMTVICDGEEVQVI